MGCEVISTTGCGPFFVTRTIENRPLLTSNFLSAHRFKTDCHYEEKRHYHLAVANFKPTYSFQLNSVTGVPFFRPADQILTNECASRFSDG